MACSSRKVCCMELELELMAGGARAAAEFVDTRLPSVSDLLILLAVRAGAAATSCEGTLGSFSF